MVRAVRDQGTVGASPLRQRKVLRTLRCAGILVALLLALGVGVAAGVLLDRQMSWSAVPPGVIPVDAQADFRLMAEAWETIQQQYVDRSAVQPRQLTYGAISGMADSLGDTGHSRFLSPELLRAEHDFTQGQLEGIGAEVQMKEGHAVIVAPLDDSPAQKAGLQPGDIILGVDGENVASLPLDQVVERIQGPAGTSVTLTILSPGSQHTRDVTMVRAHIRLQNITWAQVPGASVAHVRITAFSEGVTEDLGRALTDIQRAGLTGLILDLRSNPGGLLNEAVGTASQFLSGGNVLLERNAQGKTEPVPVQPGGVATEIPLVLLINGGTASAAEIVAGALQDAQRAKLVGETTFGTGTVLSEFHLSDGSALLLATEEWLTPKGRTIWHQGISPDVAVSLPPDVGPLLPRAEASMTPDQFESAGDAQLLTGLHVLEESATAASDPPVEHPAPPANGIRGTSAHADDRILPYHGLESYPTRQGPGALAAALIEGTGGK
jgi:carboxyl-terminal processing protease